MHDALHDAGFKATCHTCGGTNQIEELIVENGCDASETLAPKNIGGNQDPWDYRAKIGDRLCLIGGLDQFSVLTDGTPEEIRTMVFRLFETVETPPENLRVYAEEARECVY